MSIVVDTNSAHCMCANDPDGKFVMRWLLTGKGQLALSTQLLKELSRTKMDEIIADLEQAGKVIRVDDTICDTAQNEFEACGLLISNDSHVVALVHTAQSKLVFTRDQNLHTDLKNKQIISHRCNIYQNASHAHLLR